MRTLFLLFTFILSTAPSALIAIVTEEPIVVNVTTISEPVSVTPTPTPEACAQGYSYSSYFNRCIIDPTPTPTPTVTPTVTITDNNSSANIIIATVDKVELSSDNLEKDYGFVVATLADTDTSITLNKNVIVIQANSTVIVPPLETTTSLVQGTPDVSLVSGELSATISDCDQFSMSAVIAKIDVPCNQRQRAANETIFTASYSQNQLDGTLLVDVTAGFVQVTERNGTQHSLSAGENVTIQISVPRSSWVLPITNDKIFGGAENLFVWTAYEGAAGYILEYNIPKPDTFSEENAASIEYDLTTVILKPGDYETFENLVMFNAFIGKNDVKEVAEGRVFAIDDNGNIISGSVASDRITVNWE